MQKDFQDSVNKKLEKSSKEPPKILESLKLSRSQINGMIARLTQESSEPICYKDMRNKSISVTLIKLKNNSYFAKLNCEALASIEDKQSLIKDAVEFSLKKMGLPISFRNIGVGGVIAGMGFWGFLSRWQKKPPASDHAFTVFKLPGEDHLYIEDPRTPLIGKEIKFQSTFNNQICGFAATVLFYFCYKTLNEAEIIPATTPILFSAIYNNQDLKKILKNLEEKVGKSLESKEEVINSFIRYILDYKKPVYIEESPVIKITYRM
ncbi:TPA: hypothetical protein ACK8SK_003105 [Legionella pneumophila]|nr:hypothetical protein [Legionella pneumophila]